MPKDGFTRTSATILRLLPTQPACTVSQNDDDYSPARQMPGCFNSRPEKLQTEILLDSDGKHSANLDIVRSVTYDVIKKSTWGYMMHGLIHSEAAGQMCGVTSSYFRRLAIAIGCQPAKRRKGKRLWWAYRDVLAVLIQPVLSRRGVSETAALALAKSIVTGSREQTDAAFASGRTWVAMLGSECVPFLVYPHNLVTLDKERGELLKSIGKEITAFDVSQLLRDIETAAKHESGVVDADAGK